MMEELNADNLQEIIEQNEKVMVQFGAAWCGVCRILKPQFKAMAEENQNVKFYYVDAEKFPASRELANIENLPTFAGYVNGKLVKQAFGGKDAVIKGVLNEVTGN